MANKKIKIIKVRENAKLPESNNGNWYDCYISGISIVRLDDHKFNAEINWNKASELMITSGKAIYRPGDVVIVYLGIAVDIGKGYEALLLPRSSTFTKKGLLLGNSMGLVDDTYCGDEDEWKGVFYATRHGSITVGDRLLQVRVQKSNQIELEEVKTLGNKNRGGYGSTGN